MMKHYVRQQVINGTSYRTIDDYSAQTIKEIVLHIMQTDFAKAFNTLKYDITSEKHNLLDKTQFYKTGLTYKQLKDLPEEDIEDICMMLTTDKNRSSLNYVRICPYLHKNPIIPSVIINKDKAYNKPVKPIKLKILPYHLQKFYSTLRNSISSNGYYIKKELATAYGLNQGLFQNRDMIYNHVKDVLIKAGLNMDRMDYRKIPKVIDDAMIKYSRYYSTDRKQSYHKRFDGFFREYFRKESSGTVTCDTCILSPFLASHLNLDITKPHKTKDVEQKIKALSSQNKKLLLFTSKNEYIRNSKSLSYYDIQQNHTYPAIFTDDIITKMKVKTTHHPIKVYKAGLKIQKFYRLTVKWKISAKNAPIKVAPEPEPEPVKAEPSPSETSSEPPTPATNTTAETASKESTSSEEESDSDND